MSADVPFPEADPGPGPDSRTPPKGSSKTVGREAAKTPAGGALIPRPERGEAPQALSSAPLPVGAKGEVPEGPWQEVRQLLLAWETRRTTRSRAEAERHAAWAKAAAVEEDFWKKLSALRLEAFEALAAGWGDGLYPRRDKPLLEEGLRHLAERLQFDHGVAMRERWESALAQGLAWPLAEPSHSLARAGASNRAETGEGREPGDSEERKENGSSSGRGGRAARANPTSATPPPGDRRALYLLLARALHPDKEPDPEKRLEKTRWMQEATDAYARRDIGGLLALAAANPLGALDGVWAKTSARTLKGYARRLRRDIEVLESEEASRKAEIPLPWRSWWTPEGIQEKAFGRWAKRYRQELAGIRERAEAARHESGLRQLLEWAKDMGWKALW